MLSVLHTVLHTCIAFCRYSWKWINSSTNDTNCLVLVNKKQCLLGPSYIEQYDYTFRHKSYSVLLNTDETTFTTFVSMFVLKQHTVPCIPNRAIQSYSIDIYKFNRFLGPFCDFYAQFTGVYVPTSINFFVMHGNKYHEQQKHIVVDTTRQWHTYESHKKLPLWNKDCMLLTHPLEKNKPISI